MVKGKFFVVEGVDGSGKTTYAKKLVSNLNSSGRNAVYTKEPTENYQVICKTIGNDQKLSELLGYIEDRKIHNLQINSLLDRGIDVVCDRYYLSTLAYQDLGKFDSYITQQFWSNIIHPDTIYFLNCDLDTAIRNIQKRGEPISKYEIENNLKSVIENYKFAVKYCTDRVKVINLNYENDLISVG